MQKDYPNWIDNFVKLARPGVMVSMFSLLVLGGLLFGTIEFFVPGSGSRASDVFTSTLTSFPLAYYETLQWMFAAYVGGRSAQAIAEQLTIKAKVEKKDDDSAG